MVGGPEWLRTLSNTHLAQAKVSNATKLKLAFICTGRLLCPAQKERQLLMQAI